MRRCEYSSGEQVRISIYLNERRIMGEGSQISLAASKIEKELHIAFMESYQALADCASFNIRQLFQSIYQFNLGIGQTFHLIRDEQTFKFPEFDRTNQNYECSLKHFHSFISFSRTYGSLKLQFLFHTMSFDVMENVAKLPAKRILCISVTVSTINEKR